uniref:Uncharacterized protein n=1 Tax=Quercus lobata TaxID=97700 RepID=A0A7N2LPR0_QUELO
MILGEDCRTTVWNFQIGEKDGVLDSFQPDEQLKRKKKISSVRRRRDVYQTLGPSSAVESATLLAFGSLFTSPYRGSELYIDIHEAPRDQRIQSLIIEFLHFVLEILSAGKEFADKNINAHFLGAQLRLLDGQFKNHWKATFLSLKQKVESLGQSPLPIHIFMRTDLPEGNWTGSYLGDLARDSHHFNLHFLREEDELVIKTSKKVVAAKHSLRECRAYEKIWRMCKPKSDCIVTSGLAQKTVKEEICSCQDSTPLRLQFIEGVPWTEDKHRMFLPGLQKLGKGDWRGIARNYVISRTPTQVASDAQKNFIRQTNVSRRKRRSSLFDIIADEIQAESSDGPNSNSSDLVARVRKLLFRRMLVGIRDGRFAWAPSIAWTSKETSFSKMLWSTVAPDAPLLLQWNSGALVLFSFLPPDIRLIMWVVLLKSNCLC